MVYKYDFLVIGSGIAGMSFALKVAHKGKVALICKAGLEEANTYFAQGGIASVTNLAVDNFEKHIEDTMIAGDWISDRQAVEKVVREAPEQIRQLIDWGVHFDKNENGEFDLHREGGVRGRGWRGSARSRTPRGSGGCPCGCGKRGSCSASSRRRASIGVRFRWSGLRGVRTTCRRCRGCRASRRLFGVGRSWGPWLLKCLLPRLLSVLTLSPMCSRSCRILAQLYTFLPILSSPPHPIPFSSVLLLLWPAPLPVSVPVLPHPIPRRFRGEPFSSFPSSWHQSLP